MSHGETIYCTYLGHSGFLLETPSTTMLFDWYQGDLPTIPQEKPLYVFISHMHPDHYRGEVFSLVAQHYPNAQLFIGYDYSDPDFNGWIKRQSDSFQNMISCFKGNQRLFSDDGRMEITTLESTDLGVAFLVEVDNKVFYHAGDLALWAWPDFERFRSYIAPLNHAVIDYGMLPMDPRLEARSGISGVQTVEEYMGLAHFKAWSPMHLWGSYDSLDSFISSHPDLAKTMYAPAQTGLCKGRITVGERFAIDLTEY